MTARARQAEVKRRGSPIMPTEQTMAEVPGDDGTSKMLDTLSRKAGE